VNWNLKEGENALNIFLKLLFSGAGVGHKQQMIIYVLLLGRIKPKMLISGS